ncbi:MAG: hypothetical protein O2983_11955 [Planctomycetota bacterium]|nr:hypothetical protein [Planctomycetota bacterium]MDA1160315.1 hypothetical protein [Planctomycetota bacterium]
MEDNESQPLPDRKHRSFVVSDFSVRDIPFALLAFIIISVASVVLGLVVESLSPFLRGYCWGIVTTILALAIFRQISSGWATDTESDVETGPAHTKSLCRIGFR